MSDDSHSASCTFCKRKWALEPYLTQAGSSLDDFNKTIDPTTQHFAWCAWRNSNGGWTERLQQLAKAKNSQRGPKRNRLETPDFVRISPTIKASNTQ